MSGNRAPDRRVLMEVRDLQVEYPGSGGTLRAVNGVSFDVLPGETIGIVGESGCGKSTLARALMQLIPLPGRISGGSVRFEDEELLGLDPEAMRRRRGDEIAMIFQDPMTALNPVMTIGAQLIEAIKVHTDLPPAGLRERAVELLEQVGIPDPVARLGAYPLRLSGGMRQRVVIAMAISCNPALLIADEPTTALDVTVQAQIIDLLSRLRDELSMAIILVSHDLGVMAGIADHILVMYAGYVVEQGTVSDVLESPSHPYTIGLLRSLARLDQERPERLPAIPGSAPSLLELPTQCPFMPRCPEAFDRCAQGNPALAPVAAHHTVACFARSSTDTVASGAPDMLPASRAAS